MRIVLDVQALQLARASSEDDELLRGLVRALLRRSGDHAIWLLSNEALPPLRDGDGATSAWVPLERLRTFAPPGPIEEDEPGGAWRRRAAELLREHVIASLCPDAVLVLDSPGPPASDAVASIGRLHPFLPTAVLLQAPEGGDRGAARPLRLFHGRRAGRLARARRIFTWGTALPETLRGAIDAEACTSLAPEGAPLELETLADRLLAGLRSLEQGAAAAAPAPASAGVRASSRPRLAYLSPLPPQRSGIADYSAELVPELARHYEIELITPQEEVADPWLAAHCPIRSVPWFEANVSRYDRILYHVGNSGFHHHMLELLKRHPGVVVLHDFFLGHLLGRHRDAILRAVYEAHGYGALSHVQEGGHHVAVWEYPCSRGVIRDAAGVIVHSRHSTELAAHWYEAGLADRWLRVPHPHALPPPASREEARDALGIGRREFVVCAFGQLGPTKLNQRLVQAWLASGLARDRACRLVFVGGRPPDGYCDELEEAICRAGAAARIQLTDFVEPDTYRRWLAATDAAVQLRTKSRGESSAAIYDCLARGIPLVVNAHGAAAELPEGVALAVGDDVTEGELVAALERVRGDAALRANLGRAATRHVRAHHAVEKVAERYRDAIEALWRDAPHRRERALVDALAGIEAGSPPGEGDLARVSEGATRGYASRCRQLLIDVTAVAETDQGTGIQRVVRAQLQQLLRDPPEGVRVEPVVWSETGGRAHYRYARRYTMRLIGLESRPVADDEPVEVGPGDVFLGADFHPKGVMAASGAGEFRQWRRRGVKVHFMVYDLLPVQNPQWFPDTAPEVHERWLRTICEEADGLVCISASVAEELRSWATRAGIAQPPPIRHVPLGANFRDSFATRGMPPDASEVLSALRKRPSFLMVGTVEPRKGHRQALAAFERLWDRGMDVNLVIVGREGWTRVPRSQRSTILGIARSVREHPEQGHRLFWLEDASDEYLEAIYRSAACLLAASEGEGFGLPVVEAAQQGLPVIARDIPVFREVGGRHAFYFDTLDPAGLADAVRAWCELREAGAQPVPEEMHWWPWARSAALLRKILLDAPAPPRPAAGDSVAATTSETPDEDELEVLRYLESAIDVEGGVERGPLSGKECLVYSPAKTGTVTLYEALRQRLEADGVEAPPRRLLHNHRNALLIGNLRFDCSGAAERIRGRCVVRDLVRYKALTGGHLRLVTSFRDPLERAISETSQGIDDLVRRDGRLRLEEVDFDFFHDQLMNILRRSLDMGHPLEEIEPDFFDRERFDPATRFCYADRGHYEMLIVCLEHVSRWPRAFEVAFGMRDLDLTPRNITDEKPLAGRFREFRRTLELPADLVWKVYFGDHAVSRQLRWFYGRDEVEALYARAIARYVAGRRRRVDEAVPRGASGRVRGGASMLRG